MPKCLKLFLLCLLVNSYYSVNVNDTEEIDFVPSNEWKVVKTGQKIPPGLHVRSNFQTGITEAKIFIDDDKNSENTAVVLSKNEEVINNDTNSYSPDQLKKMLKNIKDENPVDNKNIEINGTKYRSYEQLKKDFESVQMSIKTDLEIIRELLDELKGNVNIRRIVEILTDLEYYLHQIDNAQNFFDMGGLFYLHKFMEYNEKDIKAEALRCLSSAIQGNSKVKIQAIKDGTLTRVLAQLKSSNEASIVNQLLVVVSAITRQFPIAQLAFINGGGLQISAEVFDRFLDEKNEKITIRLMTLISDWLKERSMDELKKSHSGDDLNIVKEKEQQYQKVNLDTMLLENGWCNRLNYLLWTRKDRNIDHLEKLITSINNIYPICLSELKQGRLQLFLQDSHTTLLKMAEEDVDDFYFKEIVKLIEDTLSLVRSESKQQPKVEKLLSLKVPLYELLPR